MGIAAELQPPYIWASTLQCGSTFLKESEKVLQVKHPCVLPMDVQVSI